MTTANPILTPHRFRARFMWIATLALCMAVASPANAAGTLLWEKDFKTAQARAKTEGKLIMVDFWATWCAYCEKLDRTTYKNPTVISRVLKTMIPVKVNTEGRKDEVELADIHGVEGLPTIGFFTAEGRAVARIDGYADAAAFLKMLTTAELQGADMTVWEKTLRTDPSNFDALYGLGAKMYELNYRDDARPLLEKARKFDKGTLPQRKRVRMMLARIIEVQSSFTDSEAVLREGIALPPEPDLDARLKFLLARCLINLGRQAEAKPVLTKLIADYPLHPITGSAMKTLQGLK